MIIAARVLAGMTQKELAQAAGIALSVLQAIEQGGGDPRNSSLLALMDALADRGVRILGETGQVVTGVILERGSASQRDAKATVIEPKGVSRP